MIISIDGPAGSGKSTIAREIAKRLGFFHLNSGKLYRWVTYNLVKSDLSVADTKDVVEMAQNLSFENIPDLDLHDDLINKMVPLVAKIPGIRKSVLAQQKLLSYGRDTVAEGRDIGSVVFPEAEIKIFLFATPEERAKRRMEEYLEQGKSLFFEQVLNEIRDRDYHDSQREHSPLVKPNGAVEINTTALSIGQVLDKIELLVNKYKESHNLSATLD